MRGKAFEDLDTPFQEFIWGDYFRTFMSRRLIEFRFELAADLATKLARLSEVPDPPGFRGRPPRRPVNSLQEKEDRVNKAASIAGA